MSFHATRTPAGTFASVAGRGPDGLRALLVALAVGLGHPAVSTPAAPSAPSEIPAAVSGEGSPAVPATPPAGAAPAPPGAPASGPSGSVDEFAAFRSEFDAGRYAAAVPHAERVLALAEQKASTPEDEEVQVALMNLGTSQHLAGDYVAAETSFQRVIDLAGRSGRPAQARLARAHAGLAGAYYDGKRYDLAVQSFERALGYIRRQEGLLTERQVPLLEKYVDSLTQLARLQEALQAQRYILRIAVRRHGENGVGLAPTLEQIGRWYTEMGAYDAARRTLKRAIDLVEAAEGEASVKLVSPLTALAACNRRQLLDPIHEPYRGVDPDQAQVFRDPNLGGSGQVLVSANTLMLEGEHALERAVKIAEQRPDASLVQVADVRTQLGDWYQTRNEPEKALPNYHKAWAAATRSGRKVDGQDLVTALFDRPVLLQIVRPEGWNRYAGRPPTEVEVRTVRVEFTVSAAGLVEAPRVVDDSGDPKHGERMLDSLKTARYRPRFENAQPVATPNQSLTQSWYVLLATAPETTPAAGSTPGAAPSQAPPATTPAPVEPAADPAKDATTG